MSINGAPILNYNLYVNDGEGSSMQYIINFIDFTSVLSYEITFDGFLNPLESGK